jgi:solute carrier family 34 (sodium-dependent phosphate cotransporter)
VPNERLPGWLKTSSRVAAVLFLLNVFFVSIALMGAFKDIGSGYGQELMNNLAHNPFIGLVMGIFITSVIQSSSTTTSLVVGLVAGGAIGSTPAEAIELAVPIIMGSNIGTSVTNTIVSLTHMGRPAEFKRAFSSAIVHDFFNILCVMVFFPLQYFTNFLGKSAGFLSGLLAGSGGAKFSSPIKILVEPQGTFVKGLMANEFFIRLVIYAAIVYIVLNVMNVLIQRARREADTGIFVAVAALIFGALFAAAQVYDHVVFHEAMGTFVLALALLFSSMVFFVKIMRGMVMGSAERLFHHYVFRTPLLGILFGLLITALVQSSSVTTSIAIPLAGAGIINIRQIFPYTLGANVGTTITALLAALSSGDVTALTVALAHFLFNVFGIIMLYPFRKLPITLAEKFAELAMRNKAIPITFILGLYIVIPFLLIVLVR